MTTHRFILLLALFATSLAQSVDELHIPEENDNQFPPVIHTDLDVTPEGSGAEDALEVTDSYSEVLPQLEDGQQFSTFLNNESVPSSDKLSCPIKCICNVEGDSNEYVVDCSDAELTELPLPLDAKTTKLNLQNNKLTFIPKEISELKNLRILNVNNNKIIDVAPGSISELPELTTLLLENNRLMEYPTDFKNSFGLTKLEEFDLGGNDMRSELKAESFSIFKALRKLTLPSATSELVQDLCTSLKESLETVCVESCINKQNDCPDAPENIDDLDIVIPALIPTVNDEENEDLFNGSITNVNTETGNEEPNLETTTVNQSGGESIADGAVFRSAVLKALEEEPTLTPTESDHGNTEQKQGEVEPNHTDDVPQVVEPNQQPSEAESKATEAQAKPPLVESNPTQVESKLSGAEPKPAEDPITRVDQKPTESKPRLTKEELSPSQAVPNSNIIDKTESGKVEATTSAKSGGVDKSVIAIVVAGMVLVVAGITIKKNWSSIRNRFSSSPRNANDRANTNTNGTAPEEVPLQEKSPV